MTAMGHQLTDLLRTAQGACVVSSCSKGWELQVPRHGARQPGSERYNDVQLRTPFGKPLMSRLHIETPLEDGICRDLAAAGWLHDAAVAVRYDHALALFQDDVVGWIQTTQPEAWASFATSSQPLRIPHDAPRSPRPSNSTRLPSDVQS